MKTTKKQTDLKLSATDVGDDQKKIYSDQADSGALGSQAANEGLDIGPTVVENVILDNVDSKIINTNIDNDQEKVDSSQADIGALDRKTATVGSGTDPPVVETTVEQTDSDTDRDKLASSVDSSTTEDKKSDTTDLGKDLSAATTIAEKTDSDLFDTNMDDDQNEMDFYQECNQSCGECEDYTTYGTGTSGATVGKCGGLVTVYASVPAVIHHKDFVEGECVETGTTSTAFTELCCANSIPLESPTYPIPITAMFISFNTLLFIIEDFAAVK